MDRMNLWRGACAALALAAGLVAAPAGAQVQYIHTDALGSVVAVTDANRNVIDRREFAPYGDQLNAPAADRGPGYTGHVEDGLTGLTYMQQRYYDPAIGRFLSVDPVGPLSDPLQHFGRYQYANNNPYKYIDPDGLDSFLASRPLQKTDLASHNYIATNADYVGDPDATVYSYGDRGDGITGRVTEQTTGPSAGTYAADVNHRKSLSLDVADKSATKIDATDEVVSEIAESVIENKSYSFVPALTADSTNSNSAASAVANKAAGSKVPVPDGSRVSPGAEQAGRVEFKIRNEER